MTLLSRTTNGLTFYQSPLLLHIGVPHAFSTRLGGESTGSLRGLNLASGQTTDPAEAARIERNWAHFLSTIGLEAPHRVEIRQVHGSRVSLVSGGRADADEADALVTESPRPPIAVRTADCCPILLSTGTGHRVAAVHAGWRGLIAGVIENAVKAMEEPPESLRAAIGPCIGRRAFEVGPEVLAAFKERLGTDAPLDEQGIEGKGHVDLAMAADRVLQEAGLRTELIDRADLCTSERADLFFSHRRDHGNTGRMAAVIAASVHPPRT